MSNQQNYTEMIDAYLTGQLNGEESSRLMELLEQDPALKDEFLLQQDIVNSLRVHRRNELKNRLNNIETGTGVSFNGAGTLKMVAGTALVALIGTGIYFAFQQNDGEGETLNPVEVTLQPDYTPAISEAPAMAETSEKKEEAALQQNKEVYEEIDAPKADAPAFAPTGYQAAKDAGIKSAPAKVAGSVPSGAKKPAAEPAEVVKPEVISFFDEQDASANTPEANTPEDKLNTIRSFSTQNIEVSTVTDKRYSFHYMFFDNQLHIYGEFSKVPYEVLEVNTGTYTRYFLYHNGLYYELNPDQRKVTRLKELNNEGMIKELEITRNEKLKR